MRTAIQPHILAVDDEPHALNAMQASLLLQGYERVTCLADSRLVRPLLEKETVDLILLDLDMPYVNGMEILEYCAELCPLVPIIVVTAAAEVASAVKCVKIGAFDYLVKPIESERLMISIGRALDMAEMRRENLSLSRCLATGSLQQPQAFAAIQTRSQGMLNALGHAEAIAPSVHPVLLLGETGVGKELVARAIHTVSRRPGTFVAFNAAGLDDQHFADTLFGHERGAFTGADRARPGLVEEAVNGTLFMDEIGDLSHSSQVKLLRLLQDGDYFPVGSDRPRHAKTRFIFATNCDLDRLLADGKFRRDLYYRLRTHEIQIPPLRERRNDIPLLVDTIIEQACRELKRQSLKAGADVAGLFTSYDFPGNVRELKGLLVDAVGRSRTAVDLAALVRTRLAGSGKSAEMVPSSLSAITVPGNGKITFPDPMPTMKEVDEAAFAEAVRRAGGNQRKTAQMLGMSQPAVSKRMRMIRCNNES